MKKNRIVIEDLLKFKYPSGLQYSPDGKTLAFTVAAADEVNNGYKRSVWVEKEGKAEQVTFGLSASAAAWKNNDELIIQRSTEDAVSGKTELFVLSMHGGEAKPWCVLPFSLGTLKQIRDGLYIAAAKIDAEDPDAYKDSDEVCKTKADEKAKNSDYQVVDEIPYWRNAQGFTNKKRTALFRVEFAGDKLKVKRITAPFQDVSGFTVKGEEVYFTALTWKRSFAKTSNVYVYNCSTGKTETIYGKNDLAVSNLFVKGGKLYGEVSDMKTYGANETGAITEISRKGMKSVCCPDRSLHNAAATDTTLGGGKANASAGDNWYTLASDVDRVNIWAFDKKFKKKVVFDRPGFVLCMDACAEKIAFVYSDWNHLCEVYEMNTDGSDIVKVTSMNDAVLEGKYIAEPQEMTYISEGEELNGWVLLPENFNPKKKYPGVLDIHGGPRAIYTTGYFHEMQVWCAEGYIVFFTNIRGSDGRGDAFSDIRHQFGVIDYKNLMDFTDAVLQKYPNLDEHRLCETGGSYGGYMTNWIIGHTDRFCAAASQRSISNWISKILISDIGIWFNTEQHTSGSIFDGWEDLWEHSPLKYAKGAKTPTLFIHSDEDYRCPLPEGMQMMQALAYQNVETRMCIFHGENHELSRGGKPTHRIRRLKEITDWFNHYAKQK